MASTSVRRRSIRSRRRTLVEIPTGPSGGGGPPGFVGGMIGGVAGFLGDLFSALPVPNFVKGFFGAEAC